MLLVDDEEDTFDRSPDMIAMLNESIAQADQGLAIPVANDPIELHTQISHLLS